MDANLKTKWVEALRSGEYVQGTMYLRRDGKHCCLGVLCELADLKISEGGAMLDMPHKIDDYEPLYELLGSSDAAKELWRRNDGNGRTKLTFPEIAKYIEENL